MSYVEKGIRNLSEKCLLKGLAPVFGVEPHKAGPSTAVDGPEYFARGIIMKKREVSDLTSR